YILVVANGSAVDTEIVSRINAAATWSARASTGSGSHRKYDDGCRLVCMSVRLQAILRRGKRTPVRLVEVLPAERPPVLLAHSSHRAFSRSPAYIARNYFGVKPHPGLSDFTDIAERYPVLVVVPEKKAET